MKCSGVFILLTTLTVAGAFGMVQRSSPAAAPTTAVEWAFDQAGHLRSWQPNGHLRDVTVTNGAMSARAVGHDPMLVLNERLELSASPWQVIEVRLKADRDGECEWVIAYRLHV